MALSQLKLSAVKKSTHVSPTVVRRHKLVRRLEEQIALASAQAQGSHYAATKQRTIIDGETGLRRSVSVPKTVKPWYFVSDSGKIYLNIKYGSRVMEISKGKPAIEVGASKDLVPVLTLVRQAALDGELDAHIEAASSDLRKGFEEGK